MPNAAVLPVPPRACATTSRDARMAGTVCTWIATALKAVRVDAAHTLSLRPNAESVKSGRPASVAGHSLATPRGSAAPRRARRLARDGATRFEKSFGRRCPAGFKTCASTQTSARPWPRARPAVRAPLDRMRTALDCVGGAAFRALPPAQQGGNVGRAAPDEAAAVIQRTWRRYAPPPVLNDSDPITQDLPPTHMGRCFTYRVQDGNGHRLLSAAAVRVRPSHRRPPGPGSRGSPSVTRSGAPARQAARARKPSQGGTATSPRGRRAPGGRRDGRHRVAHDGRARL